MKAYLDIRTILTMVFIFLVVFLVMTSLLFYNSWDLELLPDLPSPGIKIICVGLPRTATSSLTTALRDLGYEPHHFPLNLVGKMQQYLRKKDALLDLSMLGYRPSQLHVMFPDARIIYTTRSNSSWLPSMRDLLHFFNTYRCIPGVEIARQGFLKVFGSSYSSFRKAKHLYENELLELERSGVKVHYLNISDQGVGSKQKWRDLQEACVVYDETLLQSPFPNERHINVHIKQAWNFVGKYCQQHVWPTF